MAKPRVLRSIEAEDGSRCVDIFERTEGGFGFETYRRDGEDPRGWYPIGGFGHLHFDTLSDAVRGAHINAPWVEWSDKDRAALESEAENTTHAVVEAAVTDERELR